MDQGKIEVEKLKSMKTARSHKEATGYDFKVKDKSNEFPWIILSVCVALLIALL
jgi:hypothetical protein